MSLTFTITRLLAAARKRANKVGDAGLSDPDLQGLLDEVYKTLYTSVAGTGHRVFESSTTVATTGAASYTIPTDHLGTVRVERQLDVSGRSMPLREISAQEQTYWRGLTGSAYQYAIGANQLFLMPVPPTGETYKVLYIPEPPDLTTYGLTDLVEVCVPAGLSYLINGTAALAKAQTDEDPGYFQGRADTALIELVQWATMRAFTQAPSPFVEDNDVMSNGYDFGTGWWNRPR